jgi:hypothetical protein
VIVSKRVKQVHAFVAAFIAAALLLRFGLTTLIGSNDPDQPGVLIRWLRFFSYFTIQSNIVALLAALAVVRGAALDAPWQRALRLASLVGISVTGIVYAKVLAGTDHDTGLSQVANLMLHYIGPPLVVISWLLAGPFVGMAVRDIPRMLIWPFAWTGYTLLHGWATDWWPYGFIDVGDIGAGQALVNIIAIFVFAMILCLVFIGLERLRWRGRGTAALSSR